MADLNPRKLIEILEATNINLGQTGLIGQFEGICSYAVRYFDGAIGTVYLQFDTAAFEASRIELEGASADSWPTPRTVWIYNSTKQTGKTLTLKLGRKGTTVSPGSSAGGATAGNQIQAVASLAAIAASLDNHESLVMGQKAVPTGSSEAIGVYPVPPGIAVVVTADVDNGDAVCIGYNGVTTTNGYKLVAGNSISLRVDNVSAIHCIAPNAGNKVSYIVEIDSESAPG